MDWKELGETIISLGAPVLGTALLGPAGGTAVGALIAKVFGTDTTVSAIKAAVQGDPDAIIKLKEIEYSHEERLAEIAFDYAKIKNEKELSTILEINKTMREESKSEHMLQWAWRPLWGIISAAAFLVVCIFISCLGYTAITADTPDARAAIGHIPLIIGAYTTLFGIPGAILGISAWGRNKLKEKLTETEKLTF